MRIFLAGATGAIGRRLIPDLVRAGHTVTALARSPDRAKAVASLGATAVVADALRPEELVPAVEQSRPEVVIHQLTALASAGNFRKLDREFELTNRFRTEVTDTLLEAARRTGARRFIGQSFCGWPFAREGGPVKTEADRLDPDPPRVFRPILAAIRHLETAVERETSLEALALRYGFFYGPGSGLGKAGVMLAMVRQRKLPIVGQGSGIWSFIHLADAARATAAAATRGAPGLYNVVDDDPAPVSEWLPYLARVIGASPPRRIPVWLARLAIGSGGVSLMIEARGGSNAKAKRELGWQPGYPSWRQGFQEGLG